MFYKLVVDKFFYYQTITGLVSAGTAFDCAFWPCYTLGGGTTWGLLLGTYYFFGFWRLFYTFGGFSALGAFIG